MPSIQASVGIASGKQCYNIPGDQIVVQNLVDRIPIRNGGRFGESGAWLSPKWGICAPDLYRAILEFQQANRGELPYMDGHVDPGGPTITLMNRLAGTPPGGGGSPSGPTGVRHLVSVDSLFELLAPCATNWRLASSSGVSVGVGYLALGGGAYQVENTTRRESIQLRYLAAGGAASAAKVSLTASTPLHPGVSSRLYGMGLAAADKPASRFAGPLLLVSGSGQYGTVAFCVSIVYFNPPNGAAALINALRKSDLALSNLLREMALKSGAFGVSSGTANGLPKDASLSIQSGYSWLASDRQNHSKA